MADSKFRIVLEGDDRDAIQKIEKTVRKINEAKDATARWDRQRAAMAQRERQDKFRSLSIDQQRERLTQRQIALERRLAQATAQGNALRISAMRLAMARNSSSLSGMGGGGGATGGGGIGLGMLARFGGAAGIAGSIGYGLMRAVKGSLEFADNISDMAEISGISRKEMLALRRAAVSAGVSTNKVTGALSILGSSRSQALAGDVGANALFSRYGVSQKTLQSDASNLDIARQIVGSLGSGGMIPSDRGPLGALFGRNPEQTITALSKYEMTGQDAKTDATLQRLDRANTILEKIEMGVQEMKASIVTSLYDLLSKPGSVDRVRPVMGMGGMTFVSDSSSSAAPDLAAAASDVGAAVARTADSKAFIVAQAKGAGKSKRTNGMPDYGPIASTMQADSLARMGFGSGRDPEGIGLIRKQIEWQEKLYRSSNEQKQILQEGLLQ